MSNTQGGDKVFQTPWTTDRRLRLPAAIPATSTIFYGGQAAGRDVNGNFTQCDDTQKVEFIGITVDLVRTQVDPTDLVQLNGIQGDKQFNILQPQMFTALIASAAAGDEGRKVYWLYNNQVAYGGNVTNYNLAGMVWHVKDPTHVAIVPPWMLADLLGSKATMPLLTSGSVTLTKFDAGKTCILNNPTAQQITLPLSTKLGSGDQIVFFQRNAAPGAVTIAVQGSDLMYSLQGMAASSYNFAATAGLMHTFQTDGNGGWYVVA